MKYLLFLFIFIFSNEAFAEDLPMPGGGTIQYTDKDLYKWDTPNFVILGINDLQGYQVSQQIEKIKEWSIRRWGLPIDPFVCRPKVVCVPNKAVLKKLFRLDNSFAESRPEEDVCWVICDGDLSHAISVFTTEFCISNFERVHKTKICYWARRGMSILNGDTQRVRAFVSPLSGHIASNRKLLFSEPLFTLDKKALIKSSPDNVALFDKEATLLCLMLRKEFGQVRFLWLITDSSTDSVRRATGFSSYAEFDKAFKRYLYYASTDITQGRMPNSYLNVKN